MTKRIALIFPGQGAQYAGMGKDFYDAFATSREVFQLANETLGAPLSELIFGGPQEELTLTRNSQPAIYVESLALLAVVREQFPDLKPVACAGLSLGEYSALCAAERLDFISGLKLVQARGLFMDEAAKKYKGTMAAVLGMTPAAVAEGIIGIEGVWVANLNCPMQVVISGTESGVAAAGVKLKEVGAKRVIPLDVAGAFHSGLMEEARVRLAPLIEEAPLRTSSIELAMNVPGKPVVESAEMRAALIAQVTSPVRWEDDVRSLSGIDLFIEIGPGTTLSGMNRKMGLTATTVNVDKVADLEALDKVLHAKAEG